MAAKTTAAEKIINGVQLSKVDRKTIVAYAKKLGIGNDQHDTEQLVLNLQARFANLPASRTADCSKCGGTSDSELETCPYCGDANDGDEDVDEDVEVSGSASASDDDDELPTGDDDEVADVGTASHDAGSMSASLDDDPEVLAREAKYREERDKDPMTPFKEAAAAGSKKALAKLQGEDDGTEITAPVEIMAGLPATALASIRGRKVKVSKDITHKAVIVEVDDTRGQWTEQDLDAAVKRVREMKGQSAVGVWHLGNAIRDIFDKQLWKQRNKEGLPAYKNFNTFVVQELAITHQTAYSFMDVSKSYSEEQVREFGTTKLSQILSAPKEVQPSLLEAAKKGASVREIREAAQDAREAAGTDDVERTTGRRKKPRKLGQRSKTAKAKTKGTITVAAILGRTNVKMYQSMKPEARATKLSHTPHGVLDLENGVRMFLTIKMSNTGEILIVADTKRTED